MGNDRLQQFFGTVEPQAVQAATVAVASRLQSDRQAFRTIEDLDRFIATRANALAMTPARPVSVIDAPRQLDELFTELVGDAGGNDHR